MAEKSDAIADYANVPLNRYCYGHNHDHQSDNLHPVMGINTQIQQAYRKQKRQQAYAESSNAFLWVTALFKQEILKFVVCHNQNENRPQLRPI